MRDRIHGRLRVLFVGVALTATMISLPASAYAVRTLGLSSGSFKFDVQSGSTVDGEVVVINSGDEPLKVMVYASDQKVDEKGGVTYVAPTRADLASTSNPSTWVRVSMPANSKSIGNIPYLEIAPGKRVPVKFSLTVPPGIAPGDHNLLLFFESFELPKPGEGAQSVISGRIGSRVTLRVQGDVVEKLEVRPFTVPAFVVGATIPYAFTVRNLGNVDQRVGARTLLLDRNDTEVLKQIPIDGRTVFAGTNMESTGTLVVEKMPIGKYKVRIDVTQVDETGKAVNSGKDTITAIRDVWLLPLWLLILVAVIIVLVIVRLIWMLSAAFTRRKHRRDSAPVASVPEAAVAAAVSVAPAAESVQSAAAAPQAGEGHDNGAAPE